MRRKQTQIWKRYSSWTRGVTSKLSRSTEFEESDTAEKLQEAQVVMFEERAWKRPG